MVGQLLLGNLRLLLVSDRVEEQLRAHGLLGLLARLLVELFACGALRLEQLGKRVLVVRHLAEQLVELVVHLLVHHGLRQGELGLRQGGLEHLVADVGGLLCLGVLFHLLAGGVTQLLDGVELGCQLGEVVVKLGQLPLLGLLHGDLHGGFFALVVAVLDFGGELRLLAGLQALDGLVQAVHQVVGAHAVRQALGGSILELLAVDGGLEVDDGEVVLLQLALGVLQFAEALTEGVQLGIHCGVVDLELRHRDGDLGEVRHLDLGAHVDLRGELDNVVVFDLGDVDVRLPQRVEVVFRQRLLVAGRQHVVDNLLQDRAAAEASVDKLARSLATTEARDVDLLGDGLVGLVDFLAQLVERHGDVELHAGVAELVDGSLHGFLLY